MPEGFSAVDVKLERFADLRYRKQISELLLPLPERPLEPADRERLAAAFHCEHEATYGYAMPDERVEIVSLKLRARGARESTPLAWDRALDRTGGGATAGGERIAHFGRERAALATRVLGRPALGEAPLAGPLVIEEYDSTTVVPPGWTARLGAHGFVHLERNA